jgi:hypothetical protein
MCVYGGNSVTVISFGYMKTWKLRRVRRDCTCNTFRHLTKELAVTLHVGVCFVWRRQKKLICNVKLVRYLIPKYIRCYIPFALLQVKYKYTSRKIQLC